MPIVTYTEVNADESNEIVALASVVVTATFVNEVFPAAAAGRVAASDAEAQREDQGQHADECGARRPPPAQSWGVEGEGCGHHVRDSP